MYAEAFRSTSNVAPVGLIISTIPVVNSSVFTDTPAALDAVIDPLPSTLSTVIVQSLVVDAPPKSPPSTNIVSPILYPAPPFNKGIMA